MNTMSEADCFALVILILMFAVVFWYCDNLIDRAEKKAKERNREGS